MIGFDFQSFCRQYGVKYITAGHKHCKPGWVQTPCPFCTGNPGWHLGYNLRSHYFNCWRCGFHYTREVVQKLAKLPDWRGVKEILAGFQSYGSTADPYPDPSGERSPRLPPSTCEVPPTEKVTGKYERYLESRNFVPEVVVPTWGLRATGPFGDYKFRILAPIFYHGKLVSFQGRDITGKSELKYKACSLEKELIHHKDIVYGFDLVPGSAVVVVEGIADAWRLGPGAVATFGTAFCSSQVNLLRQFEKRFILYDSAKGESDETQARIQSKKLAAELSAFHGVTEIIRLDSGDPGEMKQTDADALMKELGFER